MLLQDPLRGVTSTDNACMLLQLPLRGVRSFGFNFCFLVFCLQKIILEQTIFEKQIDNKAFELMGNKVTQ